MIKPTAVAFRVPNSFTSTIPRKFTKFERVNTRRRNDGIIRYRREKERKKRGEEERILLPLRNAMKTTTWLSPFLCRPIVQFHVSFLKLDRCTIDHRYSSLTTFVREAQTILSLPLSLSISARNGFEVVRRKFKGEIYSGIVLGSPVVISFHVCMRATGSMKKSTSSLCSLDSFL